jgi:hypothetical protein
MAGICLHRSSLAQEVEGIVDLGRSNDCGMALLKR